MQLCKNKTCRFRLDSKEWFIIALFCLFAVILDFGLSYLLANEQRVGQESAVNLKLSTVRADMEGHLNANLYIIYGMAAHISVHPHTSSNEFEMLAKKLLDQSTFLKNIAVAPDFVIKYVYPLKGNEKVIGLDYRSVPDQWSQAQKAQKTGRMALNGPLELVQGGKGLIARIPVFTQKENIFWGLVSSVIYIDKMFQKVILDVQNENLDIAVRGRDGKGDQGEIFWGDPELFKPASKALKMTISLPNGSWQMAGKPKAGWTKQFSHHWMLHFVVCSVSLLGAISGINQRRHKRMLEENENRVQSMSKASHDALIMVDSSGRITFWNPAAEAMFGYTEAEVMGKDLHKLITQPADMEKAYSGLEEFSESGQGKVLGRVLEMEAIRKSGELFTVERSVASFRFQGEWYAVGSVRDITARKQFEKQLTEMATTDSLTGLCNRRFFMEQAESQRQQAIRYHRSFSLLMFDLDHFKRINDTFGHDAGDLVLKAAAKAMQTVFRSVDIIGRIGGEEFAVVLPETELETARTAAERLRNRLMETSVATEKDIINFTASIGITQMDSAETTLAQMMKRADQSLYAAKENGRNRVVAGA